MPKGNKHVPFDCWPPIRKSAAVNSSHFAESFPCARTPVAPNKTIAPAKTPASPTSPQRFIFHPSSSPRSVTPPTRKRTIPSILGKKLERLEGHFSSYFYSPLTAP